jgi:head-tail adaptor
MTIAKLDRLLTLEAAQRTPDGGGGFTLDWQAVADAPQVYAGVEALASPEELQDAQLKPPRRFRIRLRYRADLTADMRLTEGSAVYRITGLRDPEGTAAWLELLAEGE